MARGPNRRAKRMSLKRHWSVGWWPTAAGKWEMFRGCQRRCRRFFFLLLLLKKFIEYMIAQSHKCTKPQWKLSTVYILQLNRNVFSCVLKSWRKHRLTAASQVDCSTSMVHRLQDSCCHRMCLSTWLDLVCLTVLLTSAYKSYVFLSCVWYSTVASQWLIENSMQLVLVLLKKSITYYTVSGKKRPRYFWL